MDVARRFPAVFSLRSICIAAGATALCCLCALWVSRSNPWVFFSKARAIKSGKMRNESCVCSCSSGSDGGCGVSSGSGPKANGEVVLRENGDVASLVERQTGGSMMEQLVPEITTHALSYLDYPSLCRLSMTNSAMRRAANDDSAWKALYHKDFTMEQDSVTPVNGWKAYYAATKAVVHTNAYFYDIINDRSLPEMSRIWLHADYVKCVHGSGELFTGYNAVMGSWALSFNWVQGGQGVAFEIRDVRVRVLSGMAWVTMKAYVNVDSGPFHVTNVYEFHNSQWYIVHHHSSVMLGDGEVGHPNFLG